MKISFVGKVMLATVNHCNGVGTERELTLYMHRDGEDDDGKFDALGNVTMPLPYAEGEDHEAMALEWEGKEVTVTIEKK